MESNSSLEPLATDNSDAVLPDGTILPGLSRDNPFIPIADLYWCWKWSGGVEHVTRGKQQQAIAFLLVLLLPIISMAIIQSWLNQAIDEGLPGQLPQARVA
jgi:hypothetical protein